MGRNSSSGRCCVSSMRCRTAADTPPPGCRQDRRQARCGDARACTCELQLCGQQLLLQAASHTHAWLHTLPPAAIPARPPCRQQQRCRCHWLRPLLLLLLHWRCCQALLAGCCQAWRAGCRPFSLGQRTGTACDGCGREQAWRARQAAAQRVSGGRCRTCALRRCAARACVCRAPAPAPSVLPPRPPDEPDHGQVLRAVARHKCWEVARHVDEDVWPAHVVGHHRHCACDAAGRTRCSARHSRRRDSSLLHPLRSCRQHPVGRRGAHLIVSWRVLRPGRLPRAPI